MITKTSILENLRSLESSYNRAKTAKLAQFFAKLAILELCGWIEESMDHIVLSCGKKHLKVPSNFGYCEKDIVKRTYGFDYQGNFRVMLIKLVGLIAVEKIETKMDTTTREKMIAALSTLKQQRDSEAHTHLKGMTRRINAPSVTIAQFLPVYKGLAELDRLVRLMRW